MPVQSRIIAALGCFISITSASSAAEPRPVPNIIVLLADDLGYADIGIHGSKEVATPHIDSLAKNGVRCTSGYVSAPYCSPTRAGLLTGQYQQRFGHEFNPARLHLGGAGQGLPLTQNTIADHLKSAGYATGIVGKWHLGEDEKFHPQKRGFTEHFGFLAGAHSYLQSDDKNYGPILRGTEKVELDGYLTDMLAKEAVAFIDRNKAKPFFLYLAFNAVHTPMHAQEKMLKKFAHVQDMTRRTYLAMIASLDEAVGTVLAKVKDAGVEERTLIFFLSDNGGPTTKFAANGSKNSPLRGSKGDTWEGGIRVPFLVQWKGTLPAGKTFDDPVISLDIAPTALAAAGVKLDPKWNIDGVDLVPFLAGKQTGQVPHQWLYWKFGTQMAIRGGDWKLVRASRGAKEYEDVAPKPMLFNLKEDIGEQKDLAEKHPEKVRELNRQWDNWKLKLAAPAWPATLGGKPLEREP